MRSITGIIVAGLLVFALVVLPGCAGQGPADQGGGTTGNGATPPGPAEEPQAPPAGTEEGQRLVETKCAGCHTLDRVEQADKSGEQWVATVDRMVDNGLVLTDEEKQAIVAYLSARDAAR